MKCPACKSPLREKDADGMTVDMCYGGCGGIWFDAKEIEHLTARAAASLHSIWQAPVGKLNLAEPRRCPRCEEQLLERKWFSDAQKVELVESEEKSAVQRKKEAAADRMPTTAAATQSADAADEER